MTERVLLTDRLVQTLPPAAKGKRYVIHDAMLEGLAVRVTDTGTASFYTARRWPGGSKHPTGKSLGLASEMTVDKARIKFLQWNELFKQGIDPTAEERRKRRDEERARRAGDEKKRVTFGYILKSFCDDKKGQRQIGRVKQDTERECRAWLTRPAAEIRKRDVIELVKAIKRRGAPSQAHMCFGNLQRIFNWAVDNDIIETSPMIELRPKNLIGTKGVRQRVLNDAEIAAFWRGCEKLEYPYRQMFRLLLLTGQRKVEVWQAKWGEFDLAAKLWTIPEERFKSGFVHRVPLQGQSIEPAWEASCARYKGKLNSAAKNAGNSSPAYLLDMKARERRWDAS